MPPNSALSVSTRSSQRRVPIVLPPLAKDNGRAACYMSYGKDERHIDKHIWQVPIPAYDRHDQLHREAVALGREVAALVDELELDLTVHFPTLRRRIRHSIEARLRGRVSQRSPTNCCRSNMGELGVDHPGMVA